MDPATREERESLGGDWVRAEAVLPTFSKVQAFTAPGAGARVEADYWFNAPLRQVRGCIRFGAATEGMPGYVHGGAVSSVFDEALGLLSWYLGCPVATRELTVRFRTFVVLGSEVTVEGTLSPPEGFFVTGHATMSGPDGARLATAEASFVELDPERVAELSARNAGR